MRTFAAARLYTFVDTAYLRGRDPAELARALCAGGTDVLQLRAKERPRDDIRRLAETLRPITDAAGIPLVINDHPAVAREVGAPACHLGQEDFFAAGYTRVAQLPDAAGLRIGLSSHAPEQARRAVAAGADYVAVGPVFATPTKPGRPPVTLDYVRWAAAHLTTPWFAIGGLTLDNLEAVLAAGARRICVVSAILRARDVTAACRAFRRRLEEI